MHDSADTSLFARQALAFYRAAHGRTRAEMIETPSQDINPKALTAATALTCICFVFTCSGVAGSIHGLRNAAATHLANSGASEWEITSYLAYSDITQARTYTRKASRSKFADSGFEKPGKLSDQLDKHGK